MDTIIVAGAGTMGTGIAFVAALAGYNVALADPDPAAQDRAKARIRKWAERARQADAAGRIDMHSTIPPGMRAELAIEAVPERMDLKREVFAKLAQALDSQTVLATNTSSLSVSQIAANVPNPGRVLGLHFFNPPPAMKLVEVVRGDATEEHAVLHARSIVERMGKVPVATSDTPGFIVNRVARPFYLQAMRAYEAGIAGMDEIDLLARGAGFAMGPFELMDLIGIDVNLATSESVFERTGAERLRPPALQRGMISENRLGRKTEIGFYDYRDGPLAHDDAQLPADDVNADERIVIVGFSGLALELRELLAERYARIETWENEDVLDEIPLDTTIVIDVGDGTTDRSAVIGALDTLLPRETVIFADAYATSLEQAANRVQHPERLVGYGILASLANQHAVEIVDASGTGDDALALAEELFAAIARRTVLVEDRGGLVLGGIVGSIVNEAVYAVQEGVADADDVDIAMRLGTNYPLGPIAWGREIGADRVVRILQRLAGAQGAAFAPHRALRLLDVEEPDTLPEASGRTRGRDDA